MAHAPPTPDPDRPTLALLVWFYIQEALMAGKAGPETKLVKKMREAGTQKYGPRLVTIKYHGSPYSEAGVSDLLCVLDGVFVACEVKAPESYGGSVERAVLEGTTLKQDAFLDRVIRAGGIAVVVASVEQFLETLATAEHQAQHGYNT